MAEPPIAVVTGGSRGIGASTVDTLVRRGYRVVFTYRSDADAAERVSRAALAAGGEAGAFRMDLRSPDDVDGLRRHLEAAYGHVDALVLNGGVWAGGRIGTMAPDTWMDVITTNLGGAHRTVEALLDLLRAGTADASIVVVSSVIGLTGFPGDTAYAAAKAGLIGFSKSLAKELAPAIRVNAIAPGFIDTDMTAGVPERGRTSIERQILLRRTGSAREIAGAIAFLVQEATYCTGTVLVADGGLAC